MDDLSKEADLLVDDLAGDDTTRIGVGWAAAACSDLMRDLVSPNDQEPPVGPLREALRARRVFNEVIARSVIHARMSGATWKQIAATLGCDEDLAIYQYGHLDLNHLADDPAAIWAEFGKTCVAPTPEMCAPDPAEAGRRLDAWVRRHRDEREQGPVVERPVTGALGRHRR